MFAAFKFVQSHLSSLIKKEEQRGLWYPPEGTRWDVAANVKDYEKY